MTIGRYDCHQVSRESSPLGNSRFRDMAPPSKELMELDCEATVTS